MAGLDDVRAEIAAAFAAVGNELGTGPVRGFLIRAGARDDTTIPPTRGPAQRLEVGCMYKSVSLTDRARALIPETDMLVSIDATGPEPLSTDRLELDGHEHEIVAVDPLQPGGESLFYTVQVRK